MFKFGSKNFGKRRRRKEGKKEEGREGGREGGKEGPLGSVPRVQSPSTIQCGHNRLRSQRPLGTLRLGSFLGISQSTKYISS